MTTVTLNGHTYSADGSAALDMLNGGHRSNFIPCLADMLVEVGNAATSASAASASASAASTYAAALSGTSTTSTTIGTGSKSFTASTGKQWAVGQYVYLARSAAPTTYMAGQVTAYNSGTGALTVDVSATNGSGTYTDWVITIGGAKGTTGSINSLAESSKSTTYTLASGDLGTILRLTSTWTLAFTAAATLGAGWWCYLSNEGTGDITLDPNSTEQIDGLTSYVMYPGEVRKVWCDGSAFRSVVLRGFFREWTAGGTFTKPPGYQRFAHDIRAAGGSGGKSGSGSFGAGGGGGGAANIGDLPASSYGTTETITVGAGGTAVSAAGPGNAGGNSSIGSLALAYGGGAGGGNGSASHGGGGGGGIGSAGGAGGASEGTGGSGIDSVGIASDFFGAGVQASASRGWLGGGNGSSNGAAARGTHHGGGGGGGVSAAGAPQAAGSSRTGGAGGAGVAASSATSGTVPGGGGGGTQTGTASGAGGDGRVRIWGVA